MVYFSELPNICKAYQSNIVENREIVYLLADSRKLIVHSGALFFAIAGLNHDGHKFVKEAYEHGVRNFVLEKTEGISQDILGNANYVVVNSSIKALQQVAAYHRLQFSLPCVGITGSNGKTIVKEWLAELLTEREKVVKSPKSFNSQLGVPLSVWQIGKEHTIGIFEAGISQPREMEALEGVIRPQIGIFTNIGTAHDQGFVTREEKVREKTKLFQHSKSIIYCKDYEVIDQVLTEVYPYKELISWSTNPLFNPTYLIKKEEVDGRTTVTFYCSDKLHSYQLPFTDTASLENCLHCLLFLHTQGYATNEIQSKLLSLHTVGMRLELKQGVNQCYLIDDTYNNDLAGLQVALEFLKQQRQKKNKAVILSDILQAGVTGAELYDRVYDLLQNYGVSKLIGIGPELCHNQPSFKNIKKKSFYTTTSEFLQDNPEDKFFDDLVLIKGARSFSFEKIVQQLQHKIHGTVLEINLDALTHNLNFYRSKLKPGTKIMIMVKAFAYGSGSHEVAQMLQFQKVDYLGVAYPDEGVSLRRVGIEIPLMVMNAAPESFDKIVDFELEPEIFSIKQLKAFIQYLKIRKTRGKGHLKLDTGMHRLGLTEEDLSEVNKILLENYQWLELTGIFTHLAGADSAEFNEFSHEQAQTFQRFADIVCSGLPYKPLRHLVNSAGIIRFPEYHFDMVRLGIGLYGAEVNKWEQHALQAISTLKTTISQIKKIKKGQTVGYSRRGVADKDSTIATIAIGYADGFDRRFSNGVGKVIVNGHAAPVIGNVCMDMSMIDITDVPAKEGDEVIVFGKERPITELAESIGTIPYEILTNVGERVKRVFYTS